MTVVVCMLLPVCFLSPPRHLIRTSVRGLAVHDNSVSYFEFSAFIYPQYVFNISHHEKIASIACTLCYCTWLEKNALHWLNEKVWHENKGNKIIPWKQYVAITTAKAYISYQRNRSFSTSLLREYNAFGRICLSFQMLYFEITSVY